jgi:hypothetical protein
VKQGKQYKSALPAKGKLSMQLEFTSPAPTDIGAQPPPTPPPPNPVVSPPPPLSPAVTAPAPPAAGGYAIEVEAVQARGLPLAAGAFLCLSFLADPAAMGPRHYLRLDHDAGGPPAGPGPGPGPGLLALQPQWRSAPADGPDPSWSGSVCRLTTSQPPIQVPWGGAGRGG